MTVGNAPALARHRLVWIGAGTMPNQPASNLGLAQSAQAAWSARGAFTNLKHLMVADAGGNHAAPLLKERIGDE